MKKIILILLLAGPATLLTAQNDSMGVDTTDWRYEVGYTIGTWLPFLIIVALALLIIVRGHRFRKGEEE